MGLYKKSKSPYWWMSYMVNDEQFWESIKTTSRPAAVQIWKRREAEIALGKFKVGWPGKRIEFEEICNEFEQSYFAAISEGTIKGYRAYLKSLKAFFEGLVLTRITTKLVEEYRDHRRQQLSIRYKGRTLKGATVNRELECLTCVLDLAVRRQYISENPARAVKHFNELRERPDKQMLTLDQENRILKAASPHLRVGIILLVQTGGRTYTEGFRLRWDQVDWEQRLIRFGNDVKTPGSSEPLPLTDLAYRVLREWKEELGSDSPYIFPSPRQAGQPIRSVKTAWRATLRRAGVPHFPIYNLRHAFCTRLSWVAPDAVIQRAMRHTSPETKRRYQLGMVEQVREAMERANQRMYGERVTIQ
ncbi:MAG TPA: tyrosine-type recombinase/integrase [Candidatus Acidoferrum sp.]|nr:tyrosine-type recombinase/integrase [Candidatus Acidoferrum sp.]